MQLTAYSVEPPRGGPVIPTGGKPASTRFNTMQEWTPTIDWLRESSVQDENGCWNWHGIKRDRYPRFGLGPGRLVHRISCELAHGQIPPGYFACHHCDNKSCVNPAHIYIGTPQQNVWDAWERGRARKRPRAQETIARCAEIKAKIDGGKRVPDIASEYGYTVQHIYRIIREKLYLPA